MARTASNVITKLSADTTNFEQGMKRARQHSQQFGNTSKKVDGQLRMMRGGFGQVGHQIQDVAVQLQMGQNAMLVFGQQGSQIASLFGPGGAMIGAVLAVGAALSMALLPRLVGATQAMKDIESETKTLVDRFDELEGAARLTALRQAAETQADLEHGIKKANEEIEFQNAILRQQELSTNKSANAIQKAKDEIEDQRTIIQLANEQLVILEKKVDGVTDSYEKQSSSLDKRTKQLKMSQEQIDIEKIKQLELKDTEEQALITKVKLFHQTQRQIQANQEFKDSLTAQITAEQNQEKQRKSKFESLMATLDLEIAKTQETENANLNARIAVANLTDGERLLIQAKMEKLALLDKEKEKGSKLAEWEKKSAKEKANVLMSEGAKSFGAFAKNSKKAAALQKTVQIAQATMNTITGATAALDDYPVPINFAMAAMTVAQGMGMVSQIRSQSFDGGGFTGRGARTGGVDGKGGFNAILHPNETVIDHTRGSGGMGEAVIVNQTINVTTGVQSTVRAEIANLMPQISEAAQNAVLEARMRGGSYSKQLMGR